MTYCVIVDFDLSANCSVLYLERLRLSTGRDPKFPKLKFPNCWVSDLGVWKAWDSVYGIWRCSLQPLRTRTRMCICIYIHMYTCLYTHIFAYICYYTYIQICDHIYFRCILILIFDIYIPAYMHTYLCAYTHACLHKCMYISI